MSMNVETIEGSLAAGGKRFAIVVSRWNEQITKDLLEGALDELSRQGAESVRVVRVPGAWEIPLTVKLLAECGWPHAVIALGCILQGQTPHARQLASDVSSSLMGIQLATKVPIAWGVLTPDTQEQALDRAGLKMGNKGREAAQAAIEMSKTLESLS